MQKKKWKQRVRMCMRQIWQMRREGARQWLWCASLGLGLVLAVVLTMIGSSMTAFAQTCEQVRADTLRLHVQANSDTIDDQILKLKVRDAILDELAAAYEGEETPSKEDVIQWLHTRMPQLQLVAANVLEKAGVHEGVSVYLTQMYFDTTAYDDFTMPAGEYTALRVEIGAHEGHNWWCVLYPSLCISAAGGAYETEAENELIVGDYEIRFAAVEWVERLRAQTA